MKPEPVVYVVCVCNDGFAASLEVRKIYQTVPDADAKQSGMIRVVDESGEDYLYPEQWFVAMEPSAELRSAL